MVSGVAVSLKVPVVFVLVVFVVPVVVFVVLVVLVLFVVFVLVVVVFVEVVVVVTLVSFLIVALVCGPTTPKPVVWGVPPETILFLCWYDWTAASVWVPKYPVASPLKSPVLERKIWSWTTASPRDPRERVTEKVGGVYEDVEGWVTKEVGTLLRAVLV
jgi:hypothetical protein